MRSASAASGVDIGSAHHHQARLISHLGLPQSLLDAGDRVYLTPVLGQGLPVGLPGQDIVVTVG